MVIGQMRYRIIIQERVMTKDEYGGEKPEWSTYLTLKAQKKEIGGTQSEKNMEIFNSNVLEFNTHYREGIDIDEMRLMFTNIPYRILSVVEVGYRSSMTIRCEKIND